MPRKPKKQPESDNSTKNNYDEFVDEAEDGDDDVIDVDELRVSEDKSRDWRDVERYKEERALKRMVQDDLDIDLDDL